jgi:hypothetical protein
VTGLWPSLLRRFLRRPDDAADTDARREAGYPTTCPRCGWEGSTPGAFVWECARCRSPVQQAAGGGNTQAEDHARFQAEMRAGGYVEWASTPPVGRDVVECRRAEWARMEIIRPADTSPAMNVAGLYWRDVGGVVDVESSAISCGNLRLP